MSCINCDDAPVETFVRVGKANVMIVGCDTHLKELLETFRLGLKAKEKGEKDGRSS